MEGLFWLLLGVVVYAYLGYPVLLWAATRLTGRRSPGATALPGSSVPQVSILLAAHNEAAGLRTRLENLLALRYPRECLEILVGSDASTDATAAVARAFREGGIRLVEATERRGKTALLNEMIAVSSGDIVVFTDANSHFREDALERLVAPFVSPTVGCVVGELVYVNRDVPWVRAGEGLYWRLENAIKDMESRFGATLVATGAIYAMRRKLCRPIPAGISDDSLNPLLSLAAGHEVVVARGALAFEKAATSVREEFHRKARMVTRQLGAHASVGYFLKPFRPVLALQLVSHKLLRWLVPFFLLGAGVINLALLDRWLYRWTLLVALLGGLTCVLGVAAVGRGHAIPAPWRMWVYFGVVNAAALKGVVDFLRRRRRVVWSVSATTR